MKNPPRKWTPDEDQVLRAVVERFGARNWKEIAKHVPDRSHVQCLQRWNKVLRPGLKKGTWQEEEDARLLKEVNSYVDAGGEVNWTAISKCIEGRTAKQCRERWRCNLDPHINKTEWTPEEDSMIVNLQKELGNRWALLAKSLPGRTENAIKTRFRSLQRSNRRKWTPQEDSMLMQMIRTGSNFEEVSQVMTRRSLNSVRVRYKQLCEGSQASAISPPRNSSTVSNAMFPSFVSSMVHPSPSIGSELDYGSLVSSDSNMLKRSIPDFEEENHHHHQKLFKMDM
jgi:hypothetical protein